MSFVISFLEKAFVQFGFSSTVAHFTAATISGVLIILSALLLSVVILKVASLIILKRFSVDRHKNNYNSLFKYLAYFLCSLMLSQSLPVVVALSETLSSIIRLVLDVVTMSLAAATLVRLVACIQATANERMNDKIFTSKTFAQVATILIWAVASIIIASKLMGKSPTVVLSGLGAITAVLMLIFRDSLLGLVAGVEVAQNDMVRVGDWITMPRFNADGTVIDIALTTVKVQNFDNTVTMIPSSALISDAFVNWRYMSLSKGRRIKRSVWISVISIRELTDEDLTSLVSQGLLKETDKPVSNLAALELWIKRLLESNDDITKELTCMVRQLSSSDTGVPVEVYCFTKTTNWVEYETVQMRLFDLIYVTVPKFGLVIYQRTSDVRNR